MPSVQPWQHLRDPAAAAEGCDIYVTLEPCCHHGKQPPCTDAIIESGIRRVIVGSPDPNPLVAGKGIEILRKNGIEVIEDFMREECDSLNHVFFQYISTGICSSHEIRHDHGRQDCSIYRRI